MRRHHGRRASLSSSSSRSARSRSRCSCSRSVDCVTASSSLWPSKRPSWRWRSSLYPQTEVGGLLGGFWGHLRGLWRPAGHGRGDGLCLDPPAPGRGVPVALEVFALQAPADGPLCGPQDAGGLLDGVELLLHTGILPLDRGPAPAVGAVKRVTSGPCMGLFRENGTRVPFPTAFGVSAAATRRGPASVRRPAHAPPPGSGAPAPRALLGPPPRKERRRRTRSGTAGSGQPPGPLPW
jgi:hypothetical protein